MAVFFWGPRKSFVRCVLFNSKHILSYACLVHSLLLQIYGCLISILKYGGKAGLPASVSSFFMVPHNSALCVLRILPNCSHSISKVGQSRYNWRMKTGCGDLIQHQRRRQGEASNTATHRDHESHFPFLKSLKQQSCHFDTILMRLKIPCCCC